MGELWQTAEWWVGGCAVLDSREPVNVWTPEACEQPKPAFSPHLVASLPPSAPPLATIGATAAATAA